MSVNQVCNYSRALYPKSLIKIIKFYRFFGFSFLGNSSEDNEKKWSKIKRYLLMAYNLVVIFLLISLQIYIAPRIFEELQKSGMKKVMKGVFLAGRLIAISDIIFGYLLPLIKSKQFLKFLSNEEFCSIDCNTRNANKIIGSLIVEIAMFATFFIIYLGISENIFSELVEKSYRILTLILTSLLLAFYYFNGLFLIPVLYYCITCLFISQINKINSGLSKGISHKFYSLIDDCNNSKYLLIIL
jgi:hypothetical protein